MIDTKGTIDHPNSTKKGFINFKEKVNKLIGKKRFVNTINDDLDENLVEIFNGRSDSLAEKIDGEKGSKYT